MARWGSTRSLGELIHRRLALAGLLAVAVFLCSAPPAGAAEFTVPCSGPWGGASGLVRAIRMANAQGRRHMTNTGPSTIELAEDCTYTLTVPDNWADGGNGLPVITSDVIINGNGATITRGSTWWQFRIIEVASRGTLSLSEVTISGGHAADGFWGYYHIGGTGGDGAKGGGILNAGTLTIVDATVADNRAGNGGRGDKVTDVVGGSGGTGGRGGDGGGIYNTGTLTVTNASVADNQAGAGGPGGRGGTVWGGTGGTGGSGGRGGGIENTASLAMTNINISGNSAGAGGGGGNGAAGGPGGSGGGINTTASLTITNINVSGNSAGAGGGGGTGAAAGPGGSGGGINNAAGLAITNTITNINVSGNSAGDGGSSGGSALDPVGGGNGGGIENSGTLSIRDSNLSGNRAGSGGSGGNGGNGGAIDNSGTFTSQYSNVSANNAGTGGSGGNGGNGGGIDNSGTFTFLNARVANNGAGNGGPADSRGRPGIGGTGGGIYNTGTMVLTDITVTENTPDDCSGITCVSTGDSAVAQPAVAQPASLRPAFPRLAPALLQLSISPPSFHAAMRGRTIIDNSDAGARVSYVDSRRLQTSIRVYRYARRCSTRPRKPCSALVPVGIFSHMDHAGPNEFRFSGRMNGRALPAGNYELALATQLGGRLSPAVTVRFRILPA